MAKIKVIAELHYSRPDVYGNRYWACTVIRVSDGARACGRVDCGSNLLGALRKRYGPAVHSAESEVPIRDWHRSWGGAERIGCCNAEILRALDRLWRAWVKENKPRTGVA